MAAEHTSSFIDGGDPITEESLDDEPAVAAGFNDLLDHLLGGGARIADDAGLSRFCPRRLSAIRNGAEAQIRECLQGLRGMAHVLGVALEHPRADLSASVLADVTWHFHAQLNAIERWRQLAANAANLLDNRRMAQDIASRYVTWARSIGEWPDGDL